VRELEFAFFPNYLDQHSRGTTCVKCGWFPKEDQPWCGPTYTEHSRFGFWGNLETVGESLRYSCPRCCYSIYTPCKDHSNG